MSNVLKMLSRGGAAGAETDPNFNQTVLLLHGDGTNGAQNNTFLDSSTNNFTITRNGNTTQGTFSPFSVGAGEWSNYFDGNNDYFTVGSSTDWTFLHNGSSWTIEFDVFHTSTSLIVLCANSTTTTHVGFTLQINSSVANDVAFYFFRGASGSFAGSASSANLILNAWNHVGITFNTSTKTLSFFINGVASGSSSHSGFSFSTSNPTYAFHLGVEANSLLYDFSGYLSNFRISDNVRTGMTTVPTAPYTNDGNTKLLTCQSNRFVDNSSTPKTITRNGDVRVTPFSPFAPTAAYSAGTNGGSGYFDTSGDSLTVPYSSTLALGTGDCTIEAWIYLASYPQQFNNIVDVRESSVSYSNNAISFGVENDGTLNFYAGSYSSATHVLETASGKITLNAWYHVALTRASGTTKLYVNGVEEASSTNAWNQTSGTATTLYIGNAVVARQVNGYISNLRIVKGTAVTPPSGGPTAPLTAVTNTQLLCNFTNAGIIDNTGKNNLETVGNAQIDTTTKKYGTGSLEFDGTGDYLIGAGNSTELQFGTGNFTVEFWVYPNVVNTTQYLIDFRDPASATSAGFQWFIENTAKLGLYVGNTAVIAASTGSISASTWTHLALVKNGSTWTIYINGTADATTGTNTTSLTQGFLTVGTSSGNRNTTTTAKLNGYIDDLRITKGVARYTANFTAPTKEFPDQ